MMSKLIQVFVAIGLGVAGYFVVEAIGPDVVAEAKRRELVIDAPVFLWGLLAIPLLLIIRAFTLSDLPKVQQGLSFLLRSVIVLALVGSLINVQKIDREPITTATVFVVDVSESVPDAVLARAHKTLEATWLARGVNEVRLVVFAGEAEEVQLPKRGNTVPPIPRLDTKKKKANATDLQKALRFAFSLFAEDKLKRLVVVTDGLETQGDAVEELNVAQRFKIPIHYLDLTDTPRPGELMVARYQSASDNPFGKRQYAASDSEVIEGWDGLGWLYARHYLDSHETFYCPNHDGDHPLERYEAQWERGTGTIYTNYHYSGHKNWETGLHRRFAAADRLVLLTDGLRRRSDLSHRTGLNVLMGDVSVRWHELPTLLARLPVEDPVGIEVRDHHDLISDLFNYNGVID